MWPALFKAFLALVIALVQIAVVLLSYSHGQEDERHRWRDWLKERRIHVFHQGIDEQEPPIYLD